MSRLNHSVLRILAVVLFMGLIVSGCAPRTETSNQGAQATGSQSGQTASPQTQQAPGPQVFKWRMQTAWPSGSLYYTMAELYVQELEKASGGRLQIRMFPAGGVVGATDIFDAVGKGTVEMGHSWAGYWQGKEPAASLFASVPMGLTFDEYMVWLFQYGGWDLWKELYGKNNIVPVPVGIIGSEVGLVSTRPIKSLSDLNNLKVREVGLAANVMTAVGAKVTPVDVTEFYGALERKVIDAGEYGTPRTNKDLGLFEVARYWVMPGWHQPSSVPELLINKTAWDQLPEDLQQIIVSVGRSAMMMTYGLAAKADAAAYKELVDAGKIEVVRLSGADLATLRQLIDRILDEQAAKDPFFQKVVTSQREFLAEYRPWSTAQQFE